MSTLKDSVERVSTPGAVCREPACDGSATGAMPSPRLGIAATAGGVGAVGAAAAATAAGFP